jgi:hypothetical protein
MAYPPRICEYGKRGYEIVYLGKAETVKEALKIGRRSKHEYVNEILDAERKTEGDDRQC